MRYVILVLLSWTCVLSVQAYETDPPRESRTLNAGWR